MLKISVGVPTYGVIKTRTVHSIFKLLKNLPYEWYLLTQTGSYIQDNRESIVKMAQSLMSNYLLFVDYDMVFEKDTVEKLLSHDKDIISVNYNMKKLPLATVVKKEDPEGVKIDNKENGLEECCAVGMGLTLIKMRVFDKVPHPWFFIETNKDGSIKYGEDMWFCRKAREAGFKIWIDPSIKVFHEGDYLF